MSVIYEIASKITLINHVSPVLGKVIRELAELDGKIGNITKQFDKMGNAGKVVLAGIGGAASIAAIVGLEKLSKKGIELINQQEQLMRRGVQLADVNRITAEGFDKVAKAVPTAEVSEYLKVVNDLRGALGSTAEAEALAPTAMKLQALLANSADARGKQMHQAFWDILRGGEMKGIVTDPAQMAHLIESSMPWFMAQGGKLTPSMFKTFARGAGASWMNTDIDKALPAIMTSIGDLSGPTAGKAMMSLWQSMMGSTQISGQAAGMLGKLGILDCDKAKPGGFGKVIPGELLGATEHVGDVPGWVRDVLMPAVVKEAGGDRNKEQQILGQIFQNRNALRMAEMFGLPGFQEQIAKEKNIAGQVQKLEPAYQEYITKNPKGVIEGFHAQWESMLSAIGAPLMIAAMPVMKSLTSMFTSIGSISNANPQVIGDLGKTIAMLATTGGFASMGALIGMLFGPPGAAVGGLVGAMLGALTGFAAVKWDEISTGFNTIKDAIEGFWKWLKNIGKGMMGWVTSLGGLIKGSFGGGGIGGGGLINASYGDGSGASIGGSPHGSYLQYANMIKQYGGDEAENLMKIYRVEGPQGYAHGDSGMSYGPFQVYTGGGIGNQMLRAGINVRDPGSVRAQIEWMKNYGHRTGGYSQEIWHGLRDKHIGSLRSGSRVSPYSGAGRGQQEVHVHSPVYLDGKMIASNTVTHILKGSEHSRQSAYFDGYHSFAGADRQTATA